jgi:hypothetical protein
MIAWMHPVMFPTGVAPAPSAIEVDHQLPVQ